MDTRDLKIARLEREQDKLATLVNELSLSLHLMSRCLDVEKMKNQGIFVKIVESHRKALLAMDALIEGE